MNESKPPPLSHVLLHVQPQPCFQVPTALSTIGNLVVPPSPFIKEARLSSKWKQPQKTTTEHRERPVDCGNPATVGTPPSQPLNLRLGEHCGRRTWRGWRGGSRERLQRGKDGESDVILFQLKTHFLKKRKSQQFHLWRGQRRTTNLCLAVS